MSKKKLLVVGYLCVDIVNYVDGYPIEDSDQNCKDQIITTGGNGANNCKVLKEIRFDDCMLFSSFGSTDDWASEIADRQLSSLSIDITKCPRHSNENLSVSVVVVNELNGSRTIMHHKKGLREPLFDEFRNQFGDLIDFSWIHFEGRNVVEVRKMIDYILNWRNENNSTTPTISVELEKANSDLQKLAVGADFIFVSKDFAKSLAFEDMISAVKHLSIIFHGSTVICAWGDRGACVMTNDKKFFQCPSMAPDRVVDTLGAGDTFIASFISKLIQGDHCRDALMFGCRVAGAKCCMKGFSGLGNIVSKF